MVSDWFCLLHKKRWIWVGNYLENRGEEVSRNEYTAVIRLTISKWRKISGKEEGSGRRSSMPLSFRMHGKSSSLKDFTSSQCFLCHVLQVSGDFSEWWVSLISKRPLQQMIRSWLAMIFTIKLSIFLFLSIAHSIDDYSQRLKPWATDCQVGLETWMSFTLEFF